MVVVYGVMTMMNMAHDEDGNNEVCGSGGVFLWMVVAHRCSKKGDLIVSVKQATVSLYSWTVINSIFLRVKAYTS